MAAAKAPEQKRPGAIRRTIATVKSALARRSAARREFWLRNASPRAIARKLRKQPEAKQNEWLQIIARAPVIGTADGTSHHLLNIQASLREPIVDEFMLKRLKNDVAVDEKYLFGRIFSPGASKLRRGVIDNIDKLGSIARQQILAEINRKLEREQHELAWLGKDWKPDTISMFFAELVKLRKTILREK